MTPGYPAGADIRLTLCFCEIIYWMIRLRKKRVNEERTAAAYEHSVKKRAGTEKTRMAATSGNKGGVPFALVLTSVYTQTGPGLAAEKKIYLRFRAVRPEGNRREKSPACAGQKNGIASCCPAVYGAACLSIQISQVFCRPASLTYTRA